MHSAILRLVLLISGTLVFCEENITRRSIARSINQFGDHLYGQLAKQKGNIIFSPLSVHSALALLALGTSGHTEEELLSNLFLKDGEHLRTSHVYGPKERRATSDHSLHIANNLFVDKTLRLKKEFKEAARDIFLANPQGVDFKNPKLAASAINKWVASHTDNKITKLVDQSSLSNETLIILLDAIYFKGKWRLAFDKSRTVQDYIFHGSQRDVECNMMVMKPKRHKHLSYPSFTMLDLDFQGSNIRMAFVKPHINHTEAETIIDSHTFFQAVKGLKQKQVEIRIPKFKLGAEYFLKEHLISIGISDIFGDPDLRNLFEETVPARVEKVVHSTFMEIDEEGAVAAAATAVHMQTRSTRNFKFVLDSTFLLFLYDSKNELILMRGRIEDPVRVQN